MNDDPLIVQMSRLVRGDGDPCDFGCSQNDVPKMILLGKQLFPTKPYRVVSHWCWADLELNDSLAEKVKEQGMQPSFVYADKIIEDETATWDKGLAIKTTLLVEFCHNCLFVTRNTIYILVGAGSRMTVLPGVYAGLTF